LIKKTPTSAIVNLGGISLAVSIPVTTFEKLPRINERVVLITYLHVREDILDLYGFNNSEERDLFITLLKINGVGPKMALAIQSRFSPLELSQVVAEGDVRRLTTVSGIGKKTAERLLVDLKSRLDIKIDPSMSAAPATGISVMSEAISALESLGYSTQSADEAIRKAKKNLSDDSPIEEIIKQALKG